MARKESTGFGWNFSTTIVLILISVLNWLLLSSFRVKFYYTVIPLLLAIQLFLNNIIEYLLVLKVKSARWFSLLVLPGTMLHELSHAAAVLVTGGKITSISLFSLNKKTGMLGSVTYISKNDRLSFLRNVIITFSPFFGCGVALILISNIIFHQSTVFGFQAGFSGLLQKILSSMEMFVSQYSQISFDSPLRLFALYLQICFAFGAAPSSFDFQMLCESAKRNLLGLLTAVLVLAVMALAIQYAGGSVISNIIFVLFDRAILLLLLSITLLSLSILLIYSLTGWLEISVKSKIISLIVFILAYSILVLLDYSKTNSLFFSWILYLTLLFLIKNKNLFIQDGVS